MNEQSPEFKDESLIAIITKATKGLVYISESDSEVQPLSLGQTTNDIASAISAVDDRSPVEEFPVDNFFARLTVQQDWYGRDEKKRAARFARLRKLLEENLRGLKVFKVGRIQKTIYVVGISANNNLLGVKMDAVET